MFKWVMGILIGLVLLGCSSDTSDHLYDTPSSAIFNPQNPCVIQWIKNTYPVSSGDAWLEEARRRFSNPIIFDCHGGYMDGVWFLYPSPPLAPMPVEWVAQTLHHIYPKADIVLVVCNENGVDLQIPHVWYAKAKVWTFPDNSLGKYKWADLHETEIGKDDVGNIEEFVSDQPDKPLSIQILPDSQK